MKRTAIPPRENDPEISIVIPLYNAKNTINACLKSIFAQTFQDFEVVIVDDCSTDGSLDFIREKYPDPRIRIFQHTRNLNESATTEFGFCVSRGKYILIVHNDDVILENTLEIYHNAAEESGADVVLMNARYETKTPELDFPAVVAARKDIAKNPTPRFFPDKLIDRLQVEYLRRSTHWEPWTRFMRRDFICRSGVYFPKDVWSGDRIFFLGVICLAKKIQVINACTYIYRRHPGQTVNLDEDRRLKSAFTSLPIVLKYFQDLQKSPHIVSQLDPVQQRYMEVNIMMDYFDLTISGPNSTKNIEQFSEVLREIVILPEMIDPNLMLVIFNMLMTRFVMMRNVRS